MNKWKRHVVLYRILRAFITPYMKYKMRFVYKLAGKGELPEPYIVLVNHNTNYDPLLMSMAFRPHMYFVASEHIYRLGFASKLLRYLLEPIPLTKGDKDARAAIHVIRKLKQGYNVCLFAEGNRSFNGLTAPITPSTGKLVKAAKVALITYKLKGGYFTHPRWATTHRKGKMSGEIVRVYTAAELNMLSVEEINEIIQKDLFEDAYQTQLENPVRYHGKNLAEGLETALYICPSCLSIGRLRGEGNTFHCTNCDLRALYNEYGQLEGGGLPFHTVTDWDTWQTGQLERYMEAHESGDAYFSDEEQSLYMVQAGEGKRHVATGKLSLYKDRLLCAGECFLISDISGMAIYARMTLCFTLQNGTHYEVRSKELRSAVKYLKAYQIMK